MSRPGRHDDRLPRNQSQHVIGFHAKDSTPLERQVEEIALLEPHLTGPGRGEYLDSDLQVGR